MKEKLLNIFKKENLKAFFFSFIWLGIILFVIDLVSKQIVKNNMYLGQEIWLIPSFLEIHYIQNNGMAFGIDFGDGLTNAIVFIAISVIGAILLIFIFVKYYKRFNNLAKIALMLMITGTIGNLVDRAFYIDEAGNHFVVDFIGFFGTNGFPRFNVADSCLVIGCILLAVYFIIDEIKNDLKIKKEKDALKENNNKENE